MSRSLAAGIGLAADRLLGEPTRVPHPVAAFGTAMGHLERWCYAPTRPPGVAYAAAVSARSTSARGGPWPFRRLRPDAVPASVLRGDGRRPARCQPRENGSSCYHRAAATTSPAVSATTPTAPITSPVQPPMSSPDRRGSATVLHERSIHLDTYIVGRHHTAEVSLSLIHISEPTRRTP